MRKRKMAKKIETSLPEIRNVLHPVLGDDLDICIACTNFVYLHDIPLSALRGKRRDELIKFILIFALTIPYTRSETK